jgi:hypothetical protein
VICDDVRDQGPRDPLRPRFRITGAEDRGARPAGAGAQWELGVVRAREGVPVRCWLRARLASRSPQPEWRVAWREEGSRSAEPWQPPVWRNW